MWSLSPLKCLVRAKQPHCSSMLKRPLSSSTSLKKLIQPFVKKCHPDMARQQGLPDTARTVNLAAIQNLNAYIDGVNKLLKDAHGPYPFPNDTVEIDFIIPMPKHPAETTSISTGEGKTKGSKNQGFVVSNSRRKLELLVPPMNTPPGKVKHHVTRELLRLLRISDLPIPSSTLSLLDEDDERFEDEEEYPLGSGVEDSSLSQKNQQKRRKMTPWEQSRERFWKRHHRSFDLKKFNTVYREALHDAENHIRTKNWIRDNPKFRHKLLAKVLSNITFQDSILPLERLVAYRRLFLFLDEFFDDLKLEDAGRYWEDQMTLMVSEARPYGTPSSRKQKRKKGSVETGYSFTIHHDNKVTVTIPVDFENHELLQELLRNMADFMQVQNQGSGLEGDYYSALFGQGPML